MLDTLLKIVPTLLIFGLGYFLKRLGLFKKEDGDALLKLVFNVGAPALILQSFLSTRLTYDLIWFPAIAGLLLIVSFISANFLKKQARLPNLSEGIFFISSMIINSGFTLPFIIALFGNEGVARVSLFDLANGTLVYTWVYAIACSYNPDKLSHKTIIKKLLVSPPVWATIIGLVLSTWQIAVPGLVTSLIKTLGPMVAPLIMFSLGLYFEPKVSHPLPTSLIVFSRIGLGIVFGFTLSWILKLSGIDRKVLILLAASPIGFNTITFASLEKLDKEFAASVVSVGLIIGLILIPVLVLLL